MSAFLDALVEELAADPAARARLRALLEPDDRPPAGAPVYTVATLAAQLGRSERSIRGAIARGELAAVKRGRGYVISADAVAAWTAGPPTSRRGRRAPRSTRRPRPGPMSRALNANDTRRK